MKEPCLFTPTYTRWGKIWVLPAEGCYSSISIFFLTITAPYEALHLFLHYLLEVKRGVMSMIFIIFVQDINSQQ